VWAYFDASALVKRYIEEPGRREVLRLLRRYEVVTSAIVPVELRSAIRCRVAERAIDAEDAAKIHSRIAADRRFWAQVDVSREVLMAAEMLVSAHSLRALDAIHVGSAELFATRVSGSELMFVSADERQTNAAGAIGLAVTRIA
jgi:predicted nucleic acid-binding protein